MEEHEYVSEVARHELLMLLIKEQADLLRRFQNEAVETIILSTTVYDPQGGYREVLAPGVTHREARKYSRKYVCRHCSVMVYDYSFQLQHHNECVYKQAQDLLAAYDLARPALDIYRDLVHPRQKPVYAVSNAAFHVELDDEVT